MFYGPPLSNKTGFLDRSSFQWQQAMNRIQDKYSYFLSTNALSGLNDTFLNLGESIATEYGVVITACFISLLLQTPTVLRDATYSAHING